MIDIHVLNKSKRLNPLLDLINESLKTGLEKIQKVLPVDTIDIVVEDNPNAAIPETGVGGYAPTAHIVNICINPNFAGLKEKIKYEIESTLAHELHHCARESALGDPRRNLLEALVTDGLADHFDIEICGGEPRPWSIAVKDEILGKLLEKARKEFNNNNYNHKVWFFGSEDEEIPRWAGYSLGFHIVQEYLKKHPYESAGSLYKTPAEEFIAD